MPDVAPISPSALLRSDLHLLDGAMRGRGRQRTHRHHDFLRAARALRCAVSSALRRPSPLAKSAAAVALHRAAVRAGEAAALELRSARVDTAAVAMLVLAVAARIGCVAAAALGQMDGLMDREGRLRSSSRGGKGRRRGEEEEEGEEGMQIKLCASRLSIGGIVDAAL